MLYFSIILIMRGGAFMFIYVVQEMYTVSDCNPDQSTGGECSQCIDCNCVDGD